MELLQQSQAVKQQSGLREKLAQEEARAADITNSVSVHAVFGDRRRGLIIVIIVWLSHGCTRVAEALGCKLGISSFESYFYCELNMGPQTSCSHCQPSSPSCKTERIVLAYLTGLLEGWQDKYVKHFECIYLFVTFVPCLSQNSRPSPTAFYSKNKNIQSVIKCAWAINNKNN